MKKRIAAWSFGGCKEEDGPFMCISRIKSENVVLKLEHHNLSEGLPLNQRSDLELNIDSCSSELQLLQDGYKDLLYSESNCTDLVLGSASMGEFYSIQGHLQGIVHQISIVDETFLIRTPQRIYFDMKDECTYCRDDAEKAEMMLLSDTYVDFSSDTPPFQSNFIPPELVIPVISNMYQSPKRCKISSSDERSIIKNASCTAEASELVLHDDKDHVRRCNSGFSWTPMWSKDSFYCLQHEKDSSSDVETLLQPCADEQIKSLENTLDNCGPPSSKVYYVDRSPEAVLRNSAMRYTNIPSIIRKRPIRKTVDSDFLLTKQFTAAMDTDIKSLAKSPERCTKFAS